MKLPIDFENRMKNMLGSEYEEFCRALDTAPIRSSIRINTLKKNALAAVTAEFPDIERVPWCESGYFADKSVISGRHPYHAAGLFYFQEPSAMSAAEGLPIDEGDCILDLCAAPGGKSTQAAAALNGTGLLVANEINKKRASVLSSNIERMGIKNAIVTNETPERLAEKYPSFFDKIIIDAPCSGEGMFRKEPQAVTEWSLAHTLSCAARQKNIIDSAVKMLKSGGYILYSTCTFAPEENEQVVSYMTDTYGMELCPMPKLSMLSEGVPEWADGDERLKLTRRIFPHREAGEGHFAALLCYNGGNKTAQTERVPRVSGKQAVSEAVKLYREFEKEAMNITLDGRFELFGESLYLVPRGIDISGVRVLRAGLHLGTVKKNRLEPSLALALASDISEFKNVIDCDRKTADIYLSGNVISCGMTGWCAASYSGYALGWGKASGGVMKNHYPKGLRLLG